MPSGPVLTEGYGPGKLGKSIAAPAKRRARPTPTLPPSIIPGAEDLGIPTNMDEGDE